MAKCLQVLPNHVVLGARTAFSLEKEVTLLGEELRVTVSEGQLFVQSSGIEAPGAEIVATDIATCSGILHVVDTVLSPTPADGFDGGSMGDEMAPGEYGRR